MWHHLKHKELAVKVIMMTTMVKMFHNHNHHNHHQEITITEITTEIITEEVVAVEVAAVVVEEGEHSDLMREI